MINYKSTIKVSMFIKETEMVLTWKRFSLLLSLNATQKVTAFGPSQTTRLWVWLWGVGLRIKTEFENHSKRHAGILGEVEGDWYWCPLFWDFVFEENFLEIGLCFFLSLESESYFSWIIHHPPSTEGLSGGIRVFGIVHVTKPGGEPHCDDLSLSPHAWAYLITTEVSV